MRYKKRIVVCVVADPEHTLESLVFVDSVLESSLIRGNSLESRKRVGNMDPVADALIRIKNSYLVGKTTVNVKYSKLILAIVKLLEKEGYVGELKTEGREIKVALKYVSRKPVLTEVKRVSKPSLRVYKGCKELPRVLNGLGISIVSTPKGIMTDKAARKAKLGGEVLALVW